MEKHRQTLVSSPVTKARFIVDILKSVENSAEDFRISLKFALDSASASESDFEESIENALVDMETLSKNLAEVKLNQFPPTIEKTVTVIVAVVSAIIDIIGSVMTYVGGSLPDGPKAITSVIGQVLLFIAFAVLLFNNT